MFYYFLTQLGFYLGSIIGGCKLLIALEFRILGVDAQL